MNMVRRTIDNGNLFHLFAADISALVLREILSPGAGPQHADHFGMFLIARVG